MKPASSVGLRGFSIAALLSVLLHATVAWILVSDWVQLVEPLPEFEELPVEVVLLPPPEAAPEPPAEEVAADVAPPDEPPIPSPEPSAAETPEPVLEPEPEVAPEPEPLVAAAPEPEPAAEPEMIAEPEPREEPEPTVEPVPELSSEPKAAEPVPEPGSEPEATEPVQLAEPEPVVEPEQPLEPELALAEAPTPELVSEPEATPAVEPEPSLAVAPEPSLPPAPRPARKPPSEPQVAEAAPAEPPRPTVEARPQSSPEPPSEPAPQAAEPELKAPIGPRPSRPATAQQLLDNLAALRDEDVQAKARPELWKVIRAVRAQIARCWLLSPSEARNPQLSVDVAVAFDRNGGLLKAEVKEAGRMVTDEAFKDFAVSAHRALKACSPFELPADLFHVWQRFTMRFVPKQPS